MSKFLTKQRQQRNNLILSLFGSMLIHGLVALALSRHQSPESPQTDKPVEIIIVEQSKPVSSTRKQSHPVKTTPTPPPKAKPPNQLHQETSVPKTVAPPPKRKQSIAKIEPTPPINNKPEQPPTTPMEKPVKFDQISPQPKISPDVEQPDDNNRVEELKNAELLTKPDVNSDNQKTHPENNLQENSRNQKPIIPRIDKPVKPKTSQPDPNSASTFNNNSDRHESTQSEPSPPATNSRTQIDVDRRSTEKPSEGQDINPTTDENDSTAANTVKDEPSAPLSISCEENCQPEYPSALNGAEGSAGIQLTIDADGNVINARIADSNGNPQLDREALSAAKEMEFSSIERDRATVRINISFTVAGSDFERQTREEQ